MKLEKVLYTAHATSTGGREGTSKSDDGVLELKLTTPKVSAAAAPPAPTPSSCSLRAIRPASSAR
jgi:organic hydroperoxide reductase OsmC/OhrA